MKSRRGYKVTIFLWVVLFLCSPAFSQMHADSAPREGSRGVILSASKTTLGIGGKDIQLLVLLTEDGKVEWDQFVNNSVERKATVISAEQLSAIKRNLGLIKTSAFQERMGPYNTYTDTLVEVRIRMMTTNGRLTFTVVNPWRCDLPSCSQGKTRPMSVDVQAAVREVSKLRSTLAKEPVYRMCERTE